MKLKTNQSFLRMIFISAFLILSASNIFAGDATLTWLAPATNTDGTCSSDLTGHTVHFGQVSGTYQNSADLSFTGTASGNCIDSGIDSGSGCGNYLECSHAITGLTDGVLYYFAVTAYNASGNRSNYSNEVSKTVASSLPPGPVTLLSPAGVISSSAPTYSWNAVTGGENYQLWVMSSSGDVFNQWYSASETNCVSESGTCFVTPLTQLYDGDYRWWLKAGNGNGDGPWSTEMPFTVYANTSTYPGQATLVSPGGAIKTTTPTYVWNAVAEAAEYLLRVESGGVPVFERWYTTMEAGCSSGGGTCSVTPSTQLVFGDYQWFIQTSNSVGHGPLSQALQFKIKTGGKHGKGSGRKGPKK